MDPGPFGVDPSWLILFLSRECGSTRSGVGQGAVMSWQVGWDERSASASVTRFAIFAAVLLGAALGSAANAAAEPGAVQEARSAASEVAREVAEEKTEVAEEAAEEAASAQLDQAATEEFPSLALRVEHLKARFLKLNAWVAKLRASVLEVRGLPHSNKRWLVNRLNKKRLIRKFLARRLEMRMQLRETRMKLRAAKEKQAAAKETAVAIAGG